MTLQLTCNTNKNDSNDNDSAQLIANKSYKTGKMCSSLISKGLMFITYSGFIFLKIVSPYIRIATA